MTAAQLAALGATIAKLLISIFTSGDPARTAEEAARAAAFDASNRATRG